MKKFDYENMIKKSYDETLQDIKGLHELGNVLKYLDYYIVESMSILEKIYNDKDIDYQSYVELNEMISYNLKEVCRIVKNS